MNNLDRPIIFLDNDGVLTDPEAHHDAYCSRYGELMASRFGGSPEAWASANSVAFRVMMDWYENNISRFSDASFFEHLYRVEFEAAFAQVGMQPPEWDCEGHLLMRRLLFECPVAACTLIAGARETVEELAKKGYRLCLASNAHSLHCEGVLIGCGLRQHFICAFGPDLVDCPGKSPTFYKRICQHVGVKLHQAILVDDNIEPLKIAASLGLKSVLLDPQPNSTMETEPLSATIGAINELPIVLSRLVG